MFYPVYTAPLINTTAIIITRKMSLNDILSLVLAIATAMAAGLIGSFALMKRLSLAGDALSHIALPGLGLAFLLHFNPVIGGAIALFIGTFLIWKLGILSYLDTEVIVGVIFTASLAVGALVTPEEDIVNALFGGFGSISPMSFLTGMIISSIVIWFVMHYRHQLVISIFSSELAQAHGVNLKQLDLLYLLAFSLTVLLGLRFLGAILVGALIIIPAAIGRQMTHTLDYFLGSSAIAAIISVALGFAISEYAQTDLGPTIVSVAALAFFLSLLKKRL